MFGPLNRNQVTFLQFYFSNIIVLTFLFYESNFLEKFLRENVFSIFGGKIDSRYPKWFIGRHFETACQIFDFFCYIWFFLEYFTSDPNFNFNAKFVLKSMFLMLGPYGPPPLTTNRHTEDLDHKSVKA